MGCNHIISLWELELRAIEQRLEDGEISYCAAIDRLDAIHRLPKGVKQYLTKEWEKEGCPNVGHTYSD